MNYMKQVAEMLGVELGEELPFKPREQEPYWFIRANGDSYVSMFESYSTLDGYNVKLGNCYRTREEAEEHKEEWVQFFKEAVE